MAVSQNGYTANNIALTSVRTIPGTTRSIRLRNGPAGDLLLWVLAEFHRRVEPLDTGQLDDWGYAERPIRGSTTVLSNHASGTAADANATRHPQGTNPRDNFTPEKIDTIHDILRQTQGCVRWGGDYVPPALKDGMHFEIVRDEAACAAALAAVTSGEEDDVTPQEIQAVASAAAQAVWDTTVTDRNTGGATKARELLMWGHFEAARGRAAIAGLQAALAATAKDPGITEARLEEIVDSAIERHVQITGTIEIGSKP
jgi:hypothetical protein